MPKVVSSRDGVLVFVSIASLIWLGLLSGCQSPPTRITESESLWRGEPLFAPDKPLDFLKLPEGTVILDTRPRLSFGLAHLPGSVYLDVDEFFETSGRFRGRPRADTTAAVGRLARVGVSPSKPVLIVGSGPQGDGQEGRLAWLLDRLRVARIEIVSFDGISNRRVQNGEPDLNLRSEDPWSAEISPTALAEKSEVKDFATGGPVRRGERVHLLDVRSEKEFLKKRGFGEGYETPNMASINVPWTEFLTSEGRLNLSLRDRLTAVGVQPQDRVIVMSQRGVRSALVSFALRRMGYANVGNFAGGLDLLLDERF